MKDIKKLYVELKKVGDVKREKKFKDFFFNIFGFLIFASPAFVLDYASFKFIGLAFKYSFDWSIIICAFILLVGGVIYFSLAILIWLINDIHELLENYFEVKDG